MDFSFFQPVIDFFQFIGTILSTIVEGITGITLLIGGLIGLFYSLITILPGPLSIITYTFVNLFNVILIYKLIRKG